MDDQLIKPVNGNHSVAGLLSAKDQQQKKKRQDSDSEQNEENEIRDEIIKSDGEEIKVEVKNIDDKGHAIDFCA